MRQLMSGNSKYVPYALFIRLFSSSCKCKGNPRNKHALSPGHSLMDWIRLGASGKDLTGVGERAGQLTITSRQLAQHDKPTDAWIAIRGKVYNVTHYLPFHPGGPDELAKGFGKDATTLFDQVHAWVNYDSILQKCYLGRLVSIDPSIDTEELFYGKSEKSPKSPKEAIRTSPKIISPKMFPPNKVSPLNDKKILQESVNSPISKDLVTFPRFDWIQKTDYITIILYTKPFLNPHVQIGPPNSDSVLSINITYEGHIISNEIKFFKAIEWPCQIKINYETGKIDVQFKKAESMIWENYGVMQQKIEPVTVYPSEVKHKYTLLNKVEVTYNTYLLELQRFDESKVTVPIGKHIKVFGNIQGEELSRSYSPVPVSLFNKFRPQVFITDNICLLVKSYSKGNISKYISNKRKGDILELSEPIGSFNLSTIENREAFLLIAAGTGITPMLSLLIFLLERRLRKCQKVTLLFFNRTEEDILVRNQMKSLQSEDNRLTIRHFLSHADAKCEEQQGYISQTILDDAINNLIENTVYKHADIFACVCGPTPFTNQTNSLLSNLGFKKEQIHLFVG